MPWSKQQERAIKTRGKNILVAAAAGSGKTSVLVERVIQHIISGDCDINEILVVTFTNAAAGEMRQRIAQAIAQRLPDKEKERQLILLNAASISTLHSFCQNIIRQNFHQIELDPKFRLANPQEIDLLKLDVLDELFEAKYDSDNNGDFLEFTDTYGNERGDDSIYDIILKLYEYAQSQPFPEKWLQSLPDYFTMPENTKDCTWLQIIKDTVINQLQLAQDNLQIIRQEAAELNLDYCLKTIAKDTDLIDNLLSLAQTDFTELYTAVNEIKFSVMRAPKGTDEQLKERFKSMRDDVKKIITGLKDNYFAQPLDETLFFERKFLDVVLCRWDECGVTGGMLVEGDEIFGLTLGALVTPDTYAVHIEKSRRDVEGGYPYLAHSLAKALPETVKVLNREEDLGVPGLRKAKHDWFPLYQLEKGVYEIAPFEP